MSGEMPRVAKPAEYRGIVFRSKTEAIIARSFDLSEACVWEYEPPNIFGGTKIWDFWIVLVGVKRPKIFSLALECKPAEPTETYRQSIIKEPMDLYNCDRALLIANPYEPDKPRSVMWYGESGRWHSIEWFEKLLFSNMEEARNFRFDLK